MLGVCRSSSKRVRLWETSIGFKHFSRFVAVTLLCGCILISFYLRAFFLFSFFVFLLIGCFLSPRVNIAYFLTLIYLSFMRFIGLIKFPLFPQVAALFNQGETISSLFQTRHMHLPRFLVASPAMWCASQFSVSVDYAYTLYGILCFSLLSSLLLYCFQLVTKQSNNFVGLFLPFPMIALSVVMNGRLIPAFLGISIILVVYIKKFSDLNNNLLVKQKALTFKQCLFVLIGFFLTTVSSGTMMVALLQIACCQLIFSIIKRNFRFSWLAYIVVLAVAQYAIRMLMKNITFFQGEGNAILGLLSHGVGRYFIRYMPLIIIMLALLPVLVIFFINMFLRIKFNCPSFLPLLISFPVCIACGLFGFSTALMVVPSCILLLFLLLYHLMYTFRTK